MFDRIISKTIFPNEIQLCITILLTLQLLMDKLDIIRQRFLQKKTLHQTTTNF